MAGGTNICNVDTYSYYENLMLEKLAMQIQTEINDTIVDGIYAAFDNNLHDSDSIETKIDKILKKMGYNI